MSTAGYLGRIASLLVRVGCTWCSGGSLGAPHDPRQRIIRVASNRSPGKGAVIHSHRDPPPEDLKRTHTERVVASRSTNASFHWTKRPIVNAHHATTVRRRSEPRYRCGPCYKFETLVWDDCLNTTELFAAMFD